MKNILLLLLLAGIVTVFSCKKEHTGTGGGTNTQGKQYPVTFSVTNSELNTNSITGKLKPDAITDTPAHPINYLTYIVFDSLGNRVHVITQDYTTKNFGTIHDEFVPGTYTVVFAASNNMQIPDLITTNANLKSTEIGINDSLDFFTKKMTVTVGTASINQPVTLNRIDAKLQVAIQDTIPSDVTDIVVSYPDHVDFSFYSDSLLSYTSSTQFVYHIKPTDYGKKNISFNWLVYNVYAPFEVIITSDSKTKKRPAINITGVVCQSNKLTILSGKIFGNAASQYNSGFQITLNPDWGLTTTTKF